jgi:hypothetical protein
MSTINQEEHLYKIFSNVNNWLKFAEAKNAALVAFNSAAVAGIMQAYPTDKPDLMVFKGIMIALFSISICISIYTFLPILSKTFSYQKYEESKFESEKPNLNSLFYGHHCKITSKQLLTLINIKTPIENQKIPNLEMDIADQIITNSEITMSKYKLFTLAGYFTFAGVVMGIVIVFSKAF